MHAFHATVAALLKDENALAEHSAEVREWIDGWHGSKVPLDAARRLWCGRVERTQTVIGNLLLKDDRMAACAHALTGDVIVPVESGKTTVHERAGGENSDATNKINDQQVTTGSVVWFEEPLKGKVMYQNVLDANFMFAFPPAALVAERLQGCNFFAAGAVLARRRVETLSSALKAGRVTIEVGFSCLPRISTLQCA